MAIKKRKLKIAQVSPCWYPIPPKKYGGIERIVYFLCEELTKRGHDVTLFASGDSKTSAKLVPVYPTNLVKLKTPWHENILNTESLVKACQREKEFDILHSHLDHLGTIFQDLIKTPIIHTFHNPMLKRKEERVASKLQLYQRHKKETLGVFISKSQKKGSYIKFPRSQIVYNGIEITKFKFNPKPDDYFFWAGRCESYKGIENAIKTAKITGIKLLLAGKIDPGREGYFNNKIKPHLSRKIKFLGELSEKKLIRLYRGARGCLYPIEWEEPFGLVMAEAMATGTPVITFKKGAAPEVVKNKETGFVLPFLDKKGETNIEGLVDSVKRIDEIKRKKCRERVEKMFSIEKMTESYEKIYYKAINEKK